MTIQMVHRWVKALDERRVEVHSASHLGKLRDLVNENLNTALYAYSKMIDGILLSMQYSKMIGEF